MKLDEIISLARRDRAGRDISNKLTQDSSINAVYASLGIEGRLNDPAMAPLIEYSPDMTPARQRTHLENSLNMYKKELTEAVLENTAEAVKGFTDNNAVGIYLLSNPLKPAVYGNVSNEWVKDYASAREAFIFLSNYQENPGKDMSGKVSAFIKEQVDYLKSKKVSPGLISALVWVYGNHPELAQNEVLTKSQKKVKKFIDDLDFAKGRNYILNRVDKLEGKDKLAEVYRIGQALAG